MTKKKIYNEKLNDLAGEVSLIHRFLHELPQLFYFRLPDELQKKLIEIFRGNKNTIIDQVGYSMAGTANRHGIIAFRIMMISNLSNFESADGYTNSIFCE